MLLNGSIHETNRLSRVASASVSRTPEAVTDERYISPMEDSTPRHVIDPDERRTRRYHAVREAIGQVERFENFGAAVNDFFFSTVQLHENEGEDTHLLPLADLAEEAARDMLNSIVNFYARQTAFNTVLALRNVDEEMRQLQKSRKRNRRKGRNR